MQKHRVCWFVSGRLWQKPLWHLTWCFCKPGEPLQQHTTTKYKVPPPLPKAIIFLCNLRIPGGRIHANKQSSRSTSKTFTSIFAGDFLVLALFKSIQNDWVYLPALQRGSLLKELNIDLIALVLLSAYFSLGHYNRYIVVRGLVSWRGFASVLIVFSKLCI